MARILFVSPAAVRAGPTYRLLQLLRHIKDRHQVEVVVPEKGPFVDDLAAEGIVTHIVGPRKFPVRALPGLLRLIWRGGYDLVYGNSYTRGVRNSLIAARLAGRPFLWHINEIVKTGPGHRLNNFVFRFADVVVADSQASAASAAVHMRGRPVKVVYNGVDLAEFRPDQSQARAHVRRELGIPPGRPVVLNAGLICRRKGQQYGLRAAARLLAQGSEADFVFLGGMELEADYAEETLALARKLGIERQTHFPGFRDDFPLFTAGADIFLHTAESDPFPIVTLGAMAAGLPVVAFAVDGLKEQVVDGQTGRLLPPGDISGLAAALQEYLANPAAGQQAGELGRQRIEKYFTAAAVGDQLLAIIEEVIG